MRQYVSKQRHGVKARLSELRVSETPQNRGTELSLVTLRIAFFVFTVLFSVGPLHAQLRGSTEDVNTGGLEIEAVAGWDGTVDRSTPVPISFLLSNFSDHVIEGRLTLSDPYNGHDVSLGDVFLSPGATRRLTSIQSMSDWHWCIAELAHGEEVLWRRELAVSTGNSFASNINFALVINDSSKRLQFPEVVPENANSTTSEPVMADNQGRPVRYLMVKTWQLPGHPGPLLAAQAIIIPEDTFEHDINLGQWHAIAEWMCQGGIVFVHTESTKIIDRLKEVSPLFTEASRQEDQFLVHRTGLGAIYEHSQKLFKSDDSVVQQQIARIIGQQTGQHLGSLAERSNLSGMRGGRADKNRALVIGFFLIYALFSGLVALLMFRQSRRRVGVYTVVVVAGASAIAAVLGGVLRLSQGDLQWLTVTQAGAGGVVQIGKIDVQSAGARNTQVAVRSEQPDLQFVGRTRPYFSWNRRAAAFPPFTWQPSMSADDDESYQIQVPMTPWGRRRLQATAFRQDLRRMDFEIEFEPNGPVARGQPTSGVVSLKLVNHFPFEVFDCWVVIGVAPQPGDAADSDQTPAAPTQAQWNSNSMQATQVNVPIDVYDVRHISGLAAGASVQQDFAVNFAVMQNDWELTKSWDRGALTLPRVSRSGTASAWIVGRVKDSPILTIDEGRTDFLSQYQLHLFMQEILPEDMPDASIIAGAEPNE